MSAPIPAPALQAAVNVLEHHLTDAASNQGCALRCGYHGDEMAVHLAEHVLKAAAPHMNTDDTSTQKRPKIAGPPSTV